MWEITDHVCRVCLGRVLRRDDDLLGSVYRCADCGEEVTGKVENLGACGVRLRTGRNAGLRCVRHLATPESPSEVIVKFVGVGHGKV
jgi:hypothetical protein